MKRLTERDEFGNADIIGVDSAELQRYIGFKEMNRVTNALNRLSSYEETGLLPKQVHEVNTFVGSQTEQLLVKNAVLQKAFALACRMLEDSIGSPAQDDGGDLPDHWQDNLLNRARSEQICRVCGCTQDNACIGGCYWADTDLCSRCAEQK